MKCLVCDVSMGEGPDQYDCADDSETLCASSLHRESVAFLAPPEGQVKP